MDSPGFDSVKSVAGFGAGTVAALMSIKSGGLANYMLQRQQMLADPRFRASLIDEPFKAGFFGIGQGQAPPAGGAQAVAQPSDFVGPPAPGTVAAPQDVRYLPTGGHWYPAVAPLAYEQQVKEEQDRSTMIGLTSNDPAIRTQSKLAIGVPLSNEEVQQAIGTGRQMVGMAGPGSQVQYKLPGGQITVGSPYIAGNYLDPNAAAVVAARTGGVVVPGSVPGTYDVKAGERPVQGEYTDPAQAAAARQPGEVTKPTGRTATPPGGGPPVPTYYNVKQEPAGVAPLPAAGAKPPAPAATKPATPAKPAAAAPVSEQPAAPTAAPEQPAAAAPAAPAAPPTPPHQVVRQLPDGSFEPVKPPAPPPSPPAPAVTPPAAAPRAEAAPYPAPPLLAAAAPPIFGFPGRAPAAIAAPAPVMVARAEPPPYQVVPGAELGGIASGAPPAPVEPRALAPALPAVPASAVPWAPTPAGQAGEVAVTLPKAPVGTQSFTETVPIAPEKGGGSITYTGTTPEGLDMERRRLEVQKNVEKQFGNIPEAKDLQNLYVARGLANDLLNEYTPEERAGYVGWITPLGRSIFASDDPRYARFLELNDQLRKATGDEKSLGPTGYERTPAQYEQRLRTSVDTVDKMIAGQSAIADMHVADLTPKQQQQVINKYVSGPTTVHYGPYPWDPKTGQPFPTQSTTTSVPPTTTTSPFLVDRRYTVQPAQ